MNYVEQFQNLSQEEAIKSIYASLNSKALDALSVVSEGVRKVGEYQSGRHKATIHKDSDLGEYKTKFYTDGKHHEPSDAFTDDLEDAKGTAKLCVDHMCAKDSKE